MATRLPLWHRISVLAIVLAASVAIFVWGYVINIGTVHVQTATGDTFRIDGDTIAGDVRIRAGNHRVQVERPHFKTYKVQVDVRRNEVSTVAPVFVFEPYRADARALDLPFLPLKQRGADYREIPGRLASFPIAAPDLSALPSTLSRLLFSDEWTRAWTVTGEGDEALVTVADGGVIWKGHSIGRAFSGSTLYLATGKGGIRNVGRLTTEGKIESLGTLDGDGTLTLVPSPKNDRVLAIDDADGTAYLFDTGGRQRLNLEHAVTDARWSGDGSRLLLQVRLAGASAALRLALYDFTHETLLDLRAPVALADFLDTETIVAFERTATSATNADEVARQLDDARAKKIAQQVRDKLVSFGDYQDALPADLNLTGGLVLFNITKAERTEIPVRDATLNSGLMRVEAGAKQGTIFSLAPAVIESLALLPPAARD